MATNRRNPITAAEDEAAIEEAWKASGDLFLVAMRLAACREHNEPPPEWAIKALFDRADAEVDLKPYAREAIERTRYVAVYEAHYRDGLVWDPDAYERAAELLRGQPAGRTRRGTRATRARAMRASYEQLRKTLREAGIADDDPGYRWIDLPDHDKK